MATNPTYQITRYRPELEGQVIALQRNLWSVDAGLNRTYLAWKYLQNPYLPEPLIFLAMDGEHVVGFRGLYGSCWQMPGEENLTIPVAADAVVHPDHRQHGVYRQLKLFTDQALRAAHFDMNLSVSGSPVVRDFGLRSGYEGIGEWLVYPYRSQPAQHNSLLDKAWRRLSGTRPATAAPRPFDQLDRRAARHPTLRREHIRLAFAPWPEEMAELAERSATGVERIRHVKDAVYIDWRFQNPFSAYRYLFCSRERLEGYLVLQANRIRPRDQVNIVDWEAQDLGTLERLLRAAIAAGDFRELLFWCSPRQPEFLAMLARLGFGVPAAGEKPADDIHRPVFMVNYLNPESAAAYRERTQPFEKWDLRGIDSDNH